MDVCVVTYHGSADRIRPALRPVDRLLVHDNTSRNLGFGAGANAATRMGDADLIVFVNPDGSPAPDCFQRLEDALGDPGVVAVEAAQGPDWDRPPGPDGSPEWLSGACMAVRRQAFEAVGGFDERLFMYCEDVDLSYKLAPLGRLVHCAEAGFEHDERSRAFAAHHRNFRNWLVVQRRHRSASPGRMLRDAVFALRSGRLKEGIGRLTGIADYALRARHWS